MLDSAKRQRSRLIGPFAAALLSLCAAHPAGAAAPSAGEVIAHYADLAQAAYGDSLVAGRSLQTAVDAFLQHPDNATLALARTAWKVSRVPYMQTEGFRFANSVVDEVEPRLNAWPIDEGLIDYVAPSYGDSSDSNPYYALNIIARPTVTVGGKEIDARVIDKPLLRRLQQAEGVETNVATGYHAVEFLLWGQDLHGTGPGAGERPASDYDLAHCSHGNCDRRAAYLRAAASLLVDDLAELSADWAPGGKARAELMGKGEAGGLSEILTGVGSLGFGEMAGERMKLGLMLHDPEEEQDCFSDNTQNSHAYDEAGIAGIWRGRYVAIDGKVTDGPSLRDLTAAKDPAVAARLDQAIDAATAKISLIKTTADSGKMAYDQMLAPGNAEGAALINDAMQALVAQTRAVEGVATTLQTPVATNRTDHPAKIR